MIQQQPWTSALTGEVGYANFMQPSMALAGCDAHHCEDTESNQLSWAHALQGIACLQVAAQSCSRAGWTAMLKLSNLQWYIPYVQS